MAHRVVVVANKWWECDPLMGVLLNDNARPAKALRWPAPLNHPRPRPDGASSYQVALPRAVFHLNNITAEIWCISDLLEHLPDQAQFQSSSEQKMRVLPEVFRGTAPDLVVAFGTAAHPGEDTENGSVVVGSRVFLHDGHPDATPGSPSAWHGGPFDEIIQSSIPSDWFERITSVETTPPSVYGRFVVPPLNPTADARLIARNELCALSEINVWNYAEYDEKDRETIAAFARSNDMSIAASLETTHGLICIASKAPFIFVSGITDRVGYFSSEVNPRSYAQNTPAAHNAGIIVAWMLPHIDALFAG